MSLDIVVGLQYGDEGKGKIVNYLASNNNYDYCIRYNGGPNAGHTIYISSEDSEDSEHTDALLKIVTHQVPSGIVYDCKCIIGDNCYVDLGKLKTEIDELNKNGITTDNKLFISSRCNLITELHKELDSKEQLIGTTRSGIGPCAVDKYNRTGIRVTREELDKYGLTNVGLIDTADTLRKFIEENNKLPHILVEGAQGFGLDINQGDYPYVTSSHCISTDCANIGIPLIQYVKMDSCIIYGVAKIYETYVGIKKFQPEDDEILTKIQILGNEYGATTARKRQCNYLDLSLLIKSIYINQATKVIINKCDILMSPELERNCYKLYYKDKLYSFDNLIQMQVFIESKIIGHILYIKKGDILLSYSPNKL